MTGASGSVGRGIAYRQFLAALPALQSPDRMKDTPISALALSLRIAQLGTEEQRAIAALRKRLWPERTWPEDELVAGGEDGPLPAALIGIVTAKERIDAGLAALRARRRGLTATDWRSRYGGSLCERIARGYDQPHLGLPEAGWIEQARSVLDAGDWTAIERLRHALLWDQLDRIVLGHHWDLLALLVAITRFDIAIVRATWDSAAARTRIGALADRAVEACHV